MALKLSTALRNAMLESQPLKLAMDNCVLKVYSGTQPATADAAPTGTLLCTYSVASGAITREVLAQGKVVISGASGSLDTLTVNSLEIMGSSTAFDGTNTTLTLVADAIARKINNNPNNQLFVASRSGTDTIILTCKPGVGAVTWTVTSTATTLGRTDTNRGTLTAGTAPVNCLGWGDAAAGVLSKLPAQTWSGVAGNTGSAGWFRFEASVSDAGALDSTESIMRVDGLVATSAAELNLSTTTMTSGLTQTVDTFTMALPTA